MFNENLDKTYKYTIMKTKFTILRNVAIKDFNIAIFTYATYSVLKDIICCLARCM